MNKDNQNQNDDAEIEKVLSEFCEITKEATRLFEKKNNHYRNSFLKRGVSGIITRMEDKINSIESPKAGDESMEENFLDIANYAIMAAIIIRRDR